MTVPSCLLRAVLMAAALAVVASASAAPVAPGNDAAPLLFEDTAEAHRFRALVSELRCVMCQNQSLADSDALIAHELRAEVLGLMRQGLDDDAIKAHLVARYGHFVLYRPRVEPAGEGKCRRIADISMEAKVFGVGGMLESTTEKNMRQGYDASARFMNQWIRDGKAKQG